MDIASDEKFTESLLDKVLKVKKKIYDRFLDITGRYLDLVKVSDDIGTQTSLLFSPDFHRRIVKPKHKELVSFIKSKTDAKVAIHSDGAIIPVLRDLIKAGFDVINSVQINTYGIDSLKLKKDFEDKVSFCGAIDSQKVLPFNTPYEIAKEVRIKIEDLALSGGYILAPCHNIQPGVPPENICAMFEAAIKYGEYKKK